MKQTKSTALYQTPFSKAYWRDAAMELKDIRILVFAALMIALRVALKSLGIPIAADLKINIAFFINALGAMVFGPVVAILAAAVSDTLGCLLFPTGVYFFPFIFIEIAGSLVFALFLYRTRVTATRVILSRFCVDFFVNIVLNAPIMAWYYQVVLNKSYAFFQLPRILKNLALFPLESVLLILFLMVMIPLAYRMHLVYDAGDQLHLKKRQAILLGVLFLFAAGCVAGYFVYDYNNNDQASRLSTEEKVEVNTALTEDARAQGLIESDQIIVLKKVFKQLRGDTTVEFQVYATSPDTDLAKASGYRTADVKGVGTLTLTATGSAVLVQDQSGEITGLTVTPEKD